MNKELLIDSLSKYTNVKLKNILFYEEKKSEYTSKRIRESFYYLGKVLEENSNTSVCVAKIKSGFFKQGITYVATQIQKNTVSFALYSEEGLIKQNSNKKVLELIINNLENKKTGRNKTYLWCCIFLFIMICMGIISFPKILSLNEATKLTKTYNQTVSNYNNSVDAYNKLAKSAELSNIENFLETSEKLPKVSENKFSILKSLFNGNSSKVIKSDIKTINEMKLTVDEDWEIINALINPSEDWVISKLNKCEDIKSSEGITDENDPNGLLGKDGGYTGAVYFTIDKLTGDDTASPIQLGTDGGGCVEIYKNITEASNRCTYLKQFDNSFMQSGSYVMIGTMVVRTSYQLAESSQYLITNEIFESFTSN